ncbi:hypothetical protein [Neobacillus drentensis]|nr:hypothetical protein [Neobacillus drentensis]
MLFIVDWFDSEQARAPIKKGNQKGFGGINREFGGIIQKFGGIPA